MASMHVDLSDNYVDVDELVSSYHRRKTTVLFLVAAIALIFYGTISGYSALQYKTAKVETLYTTTLQLATVTASSEYCVTENPSDPACVKAKEIVADPTKAGNGSFIGPAIPGVPTEAYDIRNDPLAMLIAALLTQPFVLRLQ